MLWLLALLPSFLTLLLFLSCCAINPRDPREDEEQLLYLRNEAKRASTPTKVDANVPFP